MPTAQVSLRAVSPWRNGALSPYPASANTQPKRTPAAMTRSISARAISGFVRAVRYSAGTPARFIRLNKQFGLHWHRIPDPGGNEVVQLIIVAKRKPLRHRCNTLAIARADQPRYVELSLIHISEPTRLGMI